MNPCFGSVPQDRIGLSVIGPLKLSSCPCMVCGRIGAAVATVVPTGALTCFTLLTPALPPFASRNITLAAAARTRKPLIMMLFTKCVCGASSRKSLFWRTSRRLPELSPDCAPKGFRIAARPHHETENIRLFKDCRQAANFSSKIGVS
jgi:hypothetical protein